MVIDRQDILAVQLVLMLHNNLLVFTFLKGVDQNIIGDVQDGRGQVIVLGDVYGLVINSPFSLKASGSIVIWYILISGLHLRASLMIFAFSVSPIFKPKYRLS